MLKLQKSITELIQEHNEAQNDGRILELQQNDQWNITYIYIYFKENFLIFTFSVNRSPLYFYLA